MKKLLSIALAGALVAATTGSAMAHKARFPHRHDRHGHIVRIVPPHHNYSRRSDDGAALMFGLLALGTIAALAANNDRNDRNYDDRYYDDRYYDDYGSGGYGYNGPDTAPPRGAYGPRR